MNAESGWASELSERVADFRRRKQAAPKLPELELSLPFKNPDSVSPEPHVVLSPPWRQGLESRKSKSNLDIALEESGGHSQRRSSHPPDLSESPATAAAEEEPELTITPSAETRGLTPGSFDFNISETVPIPASDFAEIHSAPLGKRFIAGVIDGIVLIAAASLFTIVARLVPILLGVAAVRVKFGPFNLATLMCVAAFWIFTYFSAFSALTGSTPGQAAMGLAVLNLDGQPPTRQECLLRAFGYLVSIASVMLGFVWAAMDSDGLAWHDHISGTYLGEWNAGPS
ncbi:MAG TPA: RDD family protein [Terriglobia bacterium]|nr:RDD family protein [Terriglobia bacterium]